MANDLAKHLVEHGRLRLAANNVVELRLDHRKDGLDVAPLMIVGIELLGVHLEHVEHALPQLRAPTHVSGPTAPFFRYGWT